MLSKQVSSRGVGAISRVQSRGFFDFIAETKRSTGGGVSVSDKKAATESFSWEFLDYFTKYEPERAADFQKEQAQSLSAESFIAAKVPQVANFDFSKWREKIKDPQFVDRAEAEVQGVENYWSSFQRYEQTNEWSQAGWAEESTRDYSFIKIEANEKTKQEAREAQAREAMEKHRELLEEIKLDYEQLEAERDLYVQQTDTLQFALHPQLAEMSEETCAGKQTFHDYVMTGAMYQRYVKYERLAQAQNENRRQMFLDRYKQHSHLRGFFDS